MNKVLSNKKTVAIFILPSLILFAVFVLIPIIYNVYISLFQTDLMGTKNFVGLRNYMNLFNDQFFLKALKNMALSKKRLLLGIRVLRRFGIRICDTFCAKRMITIV